MSILTPEQIQKPKGNVHIYGCGGAGVKVASMFESMRHESEVGIANISVTYVDTAFSDLDPNIQPKDTYLLNDTDGSGGLRRELSKEIVEAIPKVLQLHEPKDINIVISSGSGGSGSVIAPSLVSELVRLGKQVIAIVVGDCHTAQWMENTMGTIRSYNGISNVRGRTVPLAYFENTGDATEQAVNISIAQLVTAASAIWSRQNQGLDSKDLEHFLNPEKVSDFPAQLAMLRVFVGEIPKTEESSVMTVVSLAKSREEARLGFVVDAQYIGVHPKDIADSITKVTPIHLCMLDQSYHELMDSITDKVRKTKQARSNRSTKSSFMGEVDVAGNGLVL